MAPGLISANSALAGMTFAGTFVVIALILGLLNEFETFEKIILYVILGMVGLAASCWLFCLDQLIKMLTPAIGKKRMFNFYRFVTNLWFLGVVLITYALFLFLLLVNPYIAVSISVFTTVIIGRYWKINNEW